MLTLRRLSRPEHTMAPPSQGAASCSARVGVNRLPLTWCVGLLVVVATGGMLGFTVLMRGACEGGDDVPVHLAHTDGGVAVDRASPPAVTTSAAATRVAATSVAVAVSAAVVAPPRPAAPAAQRFAGTRLAGTVQSSCWHRMHAAQVPRVAHAHAQHSGSPSWGGCMQHAWPSTSTRAPTLPTPSPTLRRIPSRHRTHTRVHT